MISIKTKDIKMSDEIKNLMLRTEKKNNDIKMINIDEYIKNNVSLENYSDEIKNLMIKIENKRNNIEDLTKDKMLTLNDLKEYDLIITETINKAKDDNILQSYSNYIAEHFHNFNNNKKLIAMTTSDINTLNELMKDKNFYTGDSIVYNPNATEEMLRELSKDYGNAIAIIENPNTPFDLLEKYGLDKDNFEVSERAIKKLEGREQNNINNIEKFLQDLNIVDTSSMEGIDNFNLEVFKDKVNQVKHSLKELSSDNREIYTNKVLNAVKEFNEELLTKKEPEQSYDFER